MLFISGQIAIDPATGEIVQSSIQEEATQVIHNIAAILKQANLGFEHILKTTIFLTDMKYFNEVNVVYANFFSDNYPARETVAVLGLPKNVRVEISVIAGR